jgi:diacylglycerol kinase family enzyme
LIVLVVCAVVALPILVLTVVVAVRRGKAERETAQAHERARRADQEEKERQALLAPPRRPFAVVVNPTKTDDVTGLRRLFRIEAHRIGRPAPLWFETTADDPGRGQAREAIAAGASTVIAAGGDGTVRAVAEVLADSGTPMGVVPMGTGNLLARNLGIPLEDLGRQIRIATSEQAGPVDVGWARATEVPPGSDDGIATREVGAGRDGWHAFTVIAGMGWDADMVHETRSELKARLGWFAYGFGGLKNSFKRRLPVRVSVDGGRAEDLKVRTVMVANCGALPGGMVLSPDSKFDDGVLDVVAVNTRFGLLGWSHLLMSVARQSRPGAPAGTTASGAPRRKSGLRGSEILFQPAKDVRVEAERPANVQLDGDMLGTAGGVDVRVSHGALKVRFPGAAE